MKKRQHCRNYQKIYEEFYGSIPIDQNGRSYEIHHIDGNHDNNDPTNLKAVTIQEHYDIHYAQGDYGACQKIAMRMDMTPEEKSSLARLSALKRVEEGTHHFLGGEIQRKQVQKMKQDGSFVYDIEWQKANSPFYNKQWQKEKAQRQIAKKTNPWQSGNRKQQTCCVCHKTMDVNLFVRYKHGENCSLTK